MTLVRVPQPIQRPRLAFEGPDPVPEPPDRRDALGAGAPCAGVGIVDSIGNTTMWRG